MANTPITDQYDATGRNWFYAKAPDRVYGKANTVLKLAMEKFEKVYHGGQDSVYPFIDAQINNTNWYDLAYDGSIGAAGTPADTDLWQAAHQEGYCFWKAAEAISPKTKAYNTGPWSKRGSETIIDQKLSKADCLMDRIGYFFERTLLDGDGTNNTCLGFVKVFDITNANYLGLDLTNALYKPYNLTIATNQNSLTYADMIDVYTELEDAGKFIDFFLCHPNAIKRLRVLGESTVERTQGGNLEIGARNISTLGAKVYTSRYMPTTTSTKIYAFNTGHHIDLGIGGKSKRKVDTGKFWLMEFGGPKPLGFEMRDWALRDDYENGTMQMQCYGTIKIACTKTEDQGYISIA